MSVLRNEGRWGFDEGRALAELRTYPGDITPTQDRVLRSLFRNAVERNGLDENRAFSEVLRSPYLTGEQADALIRISFDARNFPGARDYDREVQSVLYGEIYPR